MLNKTCAAKTIQRFSTLVYQYFTLDSVEEDQVTTNANIFYMKRFRIHFVALLFIAIWK